MKIFDLNKIEYIVNFQFDFLPPLQSSKWAIRVVFCTFLSRNLAPLSPISSAGTRQQGNRMLSPKVLPCPGLPAASRSPVLLRCALRWRPLHRLYPLHLLLQAGPGVPFWGT